MPYARKDTLTWQKGMYYHIYNRGISKSPIFREEANYLFVLGKIKEYSKANNISMIAYCLEPNHFHFLARQNGEEPAGNLPQFVFNSYTKAYNKRYEHSGTLFEGRFRAKAIQTKSHLLHLCRYIHGNPVKDGLVADLPNGLIPIISNGSANGMANWLTVISSKINLGTQRNIKNSFLST